MFASADAFLELWARESRVTSRVLRGLTDSALDVRLGGRSLGELAWHLVTAVRDIGCRTGLPLTGPTRQTSVPDRAVTVRDAYDRAAGELGDLLRKHLSASWLARTDDVYGERWSRSRTLEVLVCHEIHHRGQLTVLMRHAGLRVPSIYGPSGDEWAPGQPRRRES